MEYKALAGERIRQDARRCLHGYHKAYRQRQLAPSPSSQTFTELSSSLPSASVSAGRLGCWKFYRGELPASPGKEHVDDLLAFGGECSSCNRQLHSHWSPDELERRHDYIQWLFPLRERGVNWLAPLLTTEDANAMRGDGLVMARVLQATRMMLRFYGTEIVYTHSAAAPAQSKLDSTPSVKSSASTSGHVRLQARLQRTVRHREWAAQYDNLARRSHNYLRISRILQFLGEMGLEELKVGWLEYLASEVIAVEPARAPLAACRDSFFFWMETQYEEADRARLQRLVEKLASHPSPSAAGGSGPVVVVKDLLLPSDLVSSRVVTDGGPATSPTSAASPTEEERMTAKKQRRE